MNRWGVEGPPEEAYSRVTNPERYRPLHDFALELIDRLEARFKVEREEIADASGLTEAASAGRGVRLVPEDPESAPLLFVFTDFPGVAVRFGKWVEEGFPHCGCDACDEGVQDLREELEWRVEAVVGGGFRESIRIAPWGKAWLSRSMELPGRYRSSGEMKIERQEAERLLEGDSAKSYDWAPWPER